MRKRLSSNITSYTHDTSCCLKETKNSQAEVFGCKFKKKIKPLDKGNFVFYYAETRKVSMKYESSAGISLRIGTSARLSEKVEAVKMPNEASA